MTPDQNSTDDEPLPAPLREDARRLTRLARQAGDEREARAYREDRDKRLAAHDYTARIRDDDDTLVIYPDEWLVDGEVRVERVDDTNNAYELPLSGAGDPDDWTAVERHNAEVVAAVGDQFDDTHRANARAFADFMGNHYARRVESATPEECREFLTDYYPRNVWLDEQAAAVVRTSLQCVFTVTQQPFPLATEE